jgi:hypothetical protein
MASDNHTTGVMIEDRSGKMHVFLSPDGDHIVTKFIDGSGNQKWETTLPHGEWAWDRAVARASRAVVFL